MTPGATFIVGARRVLFATQGFQSYDAHPNYDVSADDQRFVMITRADQETDLIVVENFFEELKRLVPN